MWKNIKTLVFMLILLLALDFCAGNEAFGECGSEIDNTAFGPGEYLEFGVYLGFINAGTATMEVDNIVEVRGNLCYHLKSTAKSNAAISVLYQVNDLVESFMDVDKLYSLRYEKHLSEGNYKADKTVSFDQECQLAFYPKDTLQILECTQDALSALYYVRALSFDVGDTIPVPNHESKKNYPIKVIVHKRERISLPAGEFDCLVIEPIMRATGIFKQKGRLTVWITDDESKMPVMMRSKIPVGSVSARLIQYKKGTLFTD
ncbi:DUF3108 domain-containing protein [bacterium]|nr:DUF3108 domain-containing protein [bacterium]